MALMVPVTEGVQRVSALAGVGASRCDKNRTAWEALGRDAGFAQATQGYPGADSLYDAVR
jgi:hypothetical protein